LKAYFEKFSPGKKKEFAQYISETKRVTSKENRLNKIRPFIIEGRGLNDQYM